MGEGWKVVKEGWEKERERGRSEEEGKEGGQRERRKGKTKPNTLH